MALLVLHTGLPHALTLDPGTGEPGDDPLDGVAADPRLAGKSRIPEQQLPSAPRSGMPYGKAR
jgi:hypothetical protein